MTLNEIAAELVAGCREEREGENLDKLYAPDAVSVEAADFGQGREAQGIEAIKAKHAGWNAMFEVLDHSASDPMPHGDDRFAVIFEAKTKNRETGEVDEMKEVAVYHVYDGRIVREEFFYPTG
ncbi:nuclear transport factor 2 family protein [Jannaschia aquimarina]|uniref:SnoaL-like domain protein n=1 Tax=Jannaschia aquimarina TaxID=935700 RepID=A0A0D1D9R1_9RHOB|nr:nuclear transport factor 2 family protein [Jannaschia aquimarina]KIT16633.1 SnoaL-like domain protein [Jannaschia aquimarina]SNS93779.1 Ketosteroid isomerase-related protein [Jannaschia aquimarina]